MILQHLWLKFANQILFLTNSFYLHVNALTLKVFLIIISLLVTLSFYPIMHVNYQMTNFLVDQSYHKCDLCLHIIRSTYPKFTLDMVELMINLMNSLIYAYACCWLTSQSFLWQCDLLSLFCSVGPGISLVWGNVEPIFIIIFGN